MRSVSSRTAVEKAWLSGSWLPQVPESDSEGFPFSSSKGARLGHGESADEVGILQKCFRKDSTPQTQSVGG